MATKKPDEIGKMLDEAIAAFQKGIEYPSTRPASEFDGRGEGRLRWAGART
jgi:hypothetical protein